MHFPKGFNQPNLVLSQTWDVHVFLLVFLFSACLFTLRTHKGPGSESAAATRKPFSVPVRFSLRCSLHLEDLPSHLHSELLLIFQGLAQLSSL